MTVSVYTLRIREGDDAAESTEVRIVAASLTEAVARAEMRFGPGRIVSIEQADPDAADVAAAADPLSADDSTESPEPSEAPIVADDFIVARAPESLPDPVATEVPAVHAHGPIAYAIAGDIPARTAIGPDVPAWEGRWRPSVLLWGGAIAGLVAFALWVNFGAAPRDRFVVASTDATPSQAGLPLDGDAPAGGVLQATGVTLRRGRDVGPDDSLGAVASNWPDGGDSTDIRDPDNDRYDDGDADNDAPVDDRTVQAIGTIVGDLFSRTPANDPSARVPPPMASRYPPDQGAPWPDERIASAPPPEPATPQRWYIEVQRADRVTETLSVVAMDAGEARAIVFDRPDHPVIVHGPSTQLSW